MDEEGIPSENLDDIFDIARKRFFDNLQSIPEPYHTAVKRSKGLQESDDLHYPLKALVVKYLTEEMAGRKLNLGEIDEIEKRMDAEKELIGMTEIPDIFVKYNAEKFANEVFEIETLFGQGRFPLKKIDETIEKYKNSGVRRVNVVLDNLTFLRHIKGLKRKQSIHQRSRETRGMAVDLQFWTLDMKSRRLVSIDDVIKMLRELKKEIDVSNGDRLDVSCFCPELFYTL